MSAIDIIATMTLDAMLMDLATTLIIDAQQERLRSRSICARCNTRCRDRSQLPSSSDLQSISGAGDVPESRSATPSTGAGPAIGFNSQGNLVPGGQATGGMTIKNGVVFFDCLVCSRAIASNRYAPHLASCLGLTGASRRGTSRAAAVNGIQKNKLASERSTPSPYIDFDSEGSDAGSTGTGGGGTRKGTKNGNGKRTNSPARSGDYHPSSSTGSASNGKKAKTLHAYPSGTSSKARGASPAYSTASSHPLAQSALPPTNTASTSPQKSRSRADDDESYLSEDAEGESDDEDDGDAAGEVLATDHAALSRRKVVPAAVSGDDDDWEGSSTSGD
ncbi:hypothetical protein NliqN6_3933 [Naganishia liquefaciens]|uniref:SAGA-associated factor 11 n=1 Tax=Naganishia liquefaciens TaxID=104408 RepID=A0A8H3TV61_9TREE|nr:hypothetical protein NliqN6_3933 [Naganishia liquefaciens]